MRILYAAGNRLGSFYQLKRFLTSVHNKNYNIKIAAYKKSMGNIDIDYNLDALVNFTNPNSDISFNSNYNYYSNEIKRFNPDIIISDMEIYSSILADELKIELWQVSPLLAYYGLSDNLRCKTEIHKHYSYLFSSSHRNTDYINYILKISSRKFILSHICDIGIDISLKESYEFVRPSFVLGSDINKYEYLCVFIKSNKNIIDKLKNKNSIYFSSFEYEQYSKLLYKNINDIELYSNAIDNCKYFITDGTAVFLADAFYNQKYCISIPRCDDVETIIGSYLNEFYKIGKIHDCEHHRPIKIFLNEKVKFLSEHLEQI